MYKTINLEHTKGFLMSKGPARDVAYGKTESLDELLNSEYEKGWEFVGALPGVVNNYILVFKKRSN